MFEYFSGCQNEGGATGIQWAKEDAKDMILPQDSPLQSCTTFLPQIFKFKFSLVKMYYLGLFRISTSIIEAKLSFIAMCSMDLKK